MKILNRKSLESSKENGEKAALAVTNPFFNKEKESKLKKVLYTKLFLSLILTNFLTYSLFAPTPEAIKQEKELKSDSKSKVMSLSLILFVPYNGGQKDVAIYNKSNKKIINTITLLKEMNLGTQEDVKRFQVRVKNRDIKKIIENKNKVLYAYPQTATKINRSNVYEVNF